MVHSCPLVWHPEASLSIQVTPWCLPVLCFFPGIWYGPRRGKVQNHFLFFSPHPLLHLYSCCQSLKGYRESARVKISELSDRGWTKITLWKLQLCLHGCRKGKLLWQTCYPLIWYLDHMYAESWRNGQSKHLGGNSLALFSLAFLLKFNKGHLLEGHNSTYR